MADTLKFGPEWLRALSGGSGSTSSSLAASSVTSPPPTFSAPAGFPAKFKLAEYRYGREEMLALFLPKPTVPEELRTFPMIVSEQCLEPVAFIDMTEEEQALLSQPVNSFRIQQYNPRMTGPSSRARGSERGRGRGGRGVLYTGKGSEFDNDNPRMTSFMRPRMNRPESWDDGEKRFDRPDRAGDRAAALTSGGSGLGPLRSGFAVTEDRTSSQLSPRRDFSRSLSNDSWREIKTSSGDAEKERDWRRNGPGPVPPVAGARPGGRWRERSFDDRPGDSFSSTQRQYSAYERAFSSEGGGGEDDLPEWAVDEPNEGELPAGGTFDASGQFMPLKDTPSRSSQRNHDGEDHEHAGADEPESLASSSALMTDVSTNEVSTTKVEKTAVGTSASSGPSERSQLAEQQSVATSLPTARDRGSPKPSLPSSVVVENTPKGNVLPASSASLSVEVPTAGSMGLSSASSSIKPKESCVPTPVTNSITNGTAAASVGNHCAEAGTIPPVLPSATGVGTVSVAAAAATYVANQLSALSRSATPTTGSPNAGHVLSDEKSKLSKDAHEADFEHFDKAAEALVETLSAEDEDLGPHSGPAFRPVAHQHKQTGDVLTTHPTMGDIKPDASYDQWFYKDPQGAIQGPFRRVEMAEWFNAGYFNMALLVRRSCDDVFQPLGEVIKRFQRVPFESGPHPPPFKESVLEEQQRMMHYAALQQQQQQQAAAVLQQQAAAVAAQRQSVLLQIMTYLQTHDTYKQLPPHQLQQFANSLLAKQLQQQQQVKAMASNSAASVADGRPVSLNESPAESLWGTSNTATAMSPSPLINAHTSSMWKPPIGSNKAVTPTAVLGIQSVWELEQQQQQQQEQKLRETEEKRREIERQLKLQKDEDDKRRREAEEERRRRADATAAAAQAAADAERLQQLMRQQQQAEEQERLAAAELQQRRQQQQQAMAEAMMEKERQAEVQRRQQQEQQRQAEMQRRASAAAIAQQQQQQQAQNQAKLPSAAQWAKSKQPGPLPTMVGAVAPGHLTLAQIQEQQEEREKQQQRQLEAMRQQQQQEAMLEAARQQQQNKSWVLAAASSGIPGTKSLREIQEEERLRQQQLMENNRQQPNTAAVRLASAMGATNAGTRPAASVPSWDGAWTATKAPVPSTPSSGTGVWEKPVTSSGRLPTSGMDAGFPSLNVVSAATAGASKAPKSATASGPAAQRSKQLAAGGSGKTKEEESVSRLFGWSTSAAQSAADEFTQWCINGLRSLNDSLDAPFLARFLNSVESPEEVQEYVMSYCGNNGAVQNFIKQYLQRRRCHAPEGEDSLWEVKPAQQQPARNLGNATSSNPKLQPQQQQQRPGAAADRPAGGDSNDPRNDTTGATDIVDKKSKAKKKKMLKVDSGALLGFSVQPSSERFNVGEIEKAAD